MRAILFSGGVDSSALAVIEKPDVGIVVDYGQVPAEGELRAARAISKRIGLCLETISIDCSSLGSGDLAGSEGSQHAPSPEWWPYRNQLLVTLAAPLALRLGVDEILIGSVATDRQHADGSPEFVEALNRLLVIQEGRIGVSAPGLERTSAELVRDSGIPASLLAWTHSCHTSSLACGQCRGCIKRASVIRDAGLKPTR